MNHSIQTSLTHEQIAAWLRGLLAIAWADGDFEAEERNLITSLTQPELAIADDLTNLTPITPAELATTLGVNTELSQHFLRTAVMVAIADGLYTTAEDELLDQFCQALGQEIEVLESLRLTLCDAATGSTRQNSAIATTQSSLTPPADGSAFDPLNPVRHWLDDLKIHDPQVARFLCKMIPAQCPFERDVQLFGKKIVHIPPLCKLNPLYEQLVSLRFRALSYLADECKEDISPYC